MATKPKAGAGKPKGFRIHPSPYVQAQLQELADKGQLAKTVPEVALALIGQRLMELERDQLVSRQNLKESG